MEKTSKKPSEAREKILNTALQLFYGHGIRATGIDTIIRDSGVAKMTFYKHFPSKQRLVIEALQRGEEIWAERFRASVEKLKDPRARMLAIFDFAGAWFKDPSFRGCAYINATVEASDPKAEECALAVEHKRKISRFVETNAREAGFDDKTAKDLGKKFLLLFDGAIVRALVEGNAGPAQLAKSIAETLLASAQKS